MQPYMRQPKTTTTSESKTNATIIPTTIRWKHNHIPASIPRRIPNRTLHKQQAITTKHTSTCNSTENRKICTSTSKRQNNINTARE